MDSEGTTTASGSDRLKPKRRLSRAASLPSPSSPTLNHASASPSSSYFHKNLSGTGAASLAVASGSAEGSRGKDKEEVGEPGDLKLMGMKLKHVSLVTLALQNACLAIVMHRSRISVSPTHAYSPATAVLLNELLKGSISMVIAFKRIDAEMTLNPPTSSSSSSSSQLHPSFSSNSNTSSLMSPSPSAGYLNEKEKDTSMGPASPIFPSSRTGGGFMPSLVGGLAGSSGGGSSSSRGGAGVKQSIAGLPTNLSSLRRSPLVAFINKDWMSRFKRLGSEIFSPDCWKLSIPAILYVLQNNLQYVAAENLDVATFQVTYQMKILTTAGFSVFMLGRRLTQAKWMALLFLAIGVGIVQIQSSAPKPSATTSSLHHTAHAMNPFTGFSAVSAACFTSGLAGVYFEKVLKGSKADLWVRNVQLSLFSLIPAIAPVLFAPSHLPAGCSVMEHLLAPFHDFGFWAWTTVFVQVAGGLVTALVIKYSSNIMKGFATSLSIVLSFLVSVGFFGARITPAFVLGSSTVLMATWMYNQPEAEGGGIGIGSKGGRRGSGEKERRIPGSPVPSDAPIIGDFSRKPNHSSSMVNLQNLISSVLTPTPSRSPSGNNSPTPSFGYHVNDQGLTAANNPFLTNSAASSNAGDPIYWSGSRPPSRPSSRTGRNGVPPAGLTVNTSGL